MCNKAIIKSKLHSIAAALLCVIIMITALPFSQNVAALPITTTPIINDSLLTDLTKPVVLIKGSVQLAYASLKDAMNAIGTNSGDYTIVFIHDYSMIPNDDMNAINANATGNNVSLSITSSYYAELTPDVIQTSIFSILAGSTTAYNFFFNSDTTIYNCTFDVYGSSCSHMFGNGHNFTIGENVVVNNKGSTGRIQLYGGGDANMGTLTDRATTNLVVSSGRFDYVMAGNRNGKFTGDAKLTINGNAFISNLCACSQTANNFASGSTSKVYIDGSDGAVCANIKAGLSTSGLSATDTIDLYLTNTTSQDDSGKNNYGTITLNANNPSITNIHVDGDCQVCTQVSATNIIINNNSSLRNGNTYNGNGNGGATWFTGVLSLSGDLVLNNNSKYIHAGTGAQNVAKNIIVNGSGSGIQFYKASATAAPIKMTIGGSYLNQDNTIDLSIWKNVQPKDGNILLNYSNAANAIAENYNGYSLNEELHAVFSIQKSGANIIYSLKYSFPSYYVPTSVKDLFSFVSVGSSSSSDGGSTTFYRKYVYNSVTDEMEVYAADKMGNYSGSPIDQSKEHPQPNVIYRSDYVATKGSMVRFDEFGKYSIAVAIGTNASGDSSVSTGTACGNHSRFYNIDNKGTNSSNTNNTYESNASWAELVPTKSTCVIHKAYLVMTTTRRDNAGASTASIESNLINNPMKLMYGDDVMLSNGYLPDSFILAKEGTNKENINSDTPTLLYDARGSGSGLGEAMTITDVTDFVKAHGYGTYYGVDIPYEGADVDATIAWRLIVLEEDSSMNFIRKVSLQMGPISNGNLIDGEPACVTLDLDGLTTPDDIDGSGFSGQLLMIGSDNTTDANAGGGKGSNLHNTFYPDPVNKPTEFVQIASNDPATPYIDRPRGHWSQGLMDINGVNLTSDQVSHVEDRNGAMGIDMSLLTVTNTKNEDWEKNGGHNIFLTSSSPQIKLTSEKDSTGIGYIDVLGISTDVSLPKFDTEIWHTDICTTPARGTDIVAGQPVIVRGSAVNVTPTVSAVQGSFNTILRVHIDEKLTNIRDLNDENLGQITAVFHNYDSVTDQTVDENIIGVFDSVTNDVTFDFGSEFLGIRLYNSKNDAIDFVFKADTDNEPTIDDSDVNYTNDIGVWGQTIYQNNEIIQTPFACYDYAKDVFDTYTNYIRVAKTVTGDFADPNQEFSFTVTISNTLGGHYPEGMQLRYTGGVLDGIDVEAPQSGTFTIDENGQISFTLKHGQYVCFEGIMGTITVTEESTNGYTMSYENILLTESGEVKELNVGYGGTTGEILIGKNESRQINIYNNKSMVPAVGIRAPEVVAYVIMVCIAIVGIVLVLVSIKRRNNRLK